jgi:hypothetical protein
MMNDTSTAVPDLRYDNETLRAALRVLRQENDSLRDTNDDLATRIGSLLGRLKVTAGQRDEAETRVDKLQAVRRDLHKVIDALNDALKTGRMVDGNRPRPVKIETLSELDALPCASSDVGNDDVHSYIYGAAIRSASGGLYYRCADGMWRLPGAPTWVPSSDIPLPVWWVWAPPVVMP